METQSYHYALIARAIAHIEAQHPRQLSLEEIAAHVGLSPAHFQRVFSQWAGVSPKRFQQYLTLNLAKRLLAQSTPLMEASLDLGLSSPSRLHDLFLTWEAMTPGDYARGGEGLTISYHWQDSEFGDMLTLATDRGICGLSFSAEMGRDAAFADMARRWPNARFTETDQAHLKALGAETKLHLIGAPFQIKVWEALLQIPSGRVSTYGQIAEKIDRPKAARAVGTAIGQNPISWLIPCHRVLRASGEMGGYHWGLPLKRAMLTREAVRLDAESLV